MKKQDMFKVTYGSKLYGTSTPTSDTDEKVVYLPDLQDLLLLTKLPIFKQRFDAEGNSIGDGFTMPDNGVETEYFPLQTFVRDFVAGQTYAVEIAFAYANGPAPGYGSDELNAYLLVKELVEKFANAEVYSMVGFAMKQTFDYVKRGERLNDAQSVLDVVDKYTAMYMPNESAVFYTLNPRLDTMIEGKTLLEYLAADTGLETEVLTNGKKPQNSLKLNGRFYLETTTLSHFREQVVKIIKSFGVRSVEASLTSVEWKSLSHALRVYQQAIELLDTGNMTFPRPNAEYLLSVKQGKENIEEVKAQLLALDDEVQEKILSSTMQKRTPELIAASEEWLLNVLMDLYKLEKK